MNCLSFQACLCHGLMWFILNFVNDFKVANLPSFKPIDLQLKYKVQLKSIISIMTISCAAHNALEHGGHKMQWAL